MNDDTKPDDADLLAGLHDGAWLDAQTFPPLTYHVDRLIPEGFVLLVGAPKIGKSWLVLDVALGVAYGGYALGGIHVERRPVLYLALEDGDRRLQDRCRKLLAGSPIPAGLQYLTAVAPGTVLATIGAWLGFCHHPTPLVILDTLGKVMPPSLLGESPYQRDYRVASALKRLVDAHPGSSLVVNHHDRKAAAEDFVDAVSGTHGLAGAADTVIVLTRNRQETAGLVQVTGRDVLEGEYALEFAGGTSWILDGGDFADAAARAHQRRAAQTLGDRSLDILAYVGEHPEGVRANQVEAIFDADARRYLARLADAGQLVRLSRGLYGTPRPLSQPSRLSQPTPDGTLGTDGTPPGGDRLDPFEPPT